VALRGGWPAQLEVARTAEEAVDYLFGDITEVPRLVLLTSGFRTLGALRCSGVSARTSVRV
jgi:hypothetical protein